MKKHNKVLAFIKVIRESFHDSMVVYRYGGCYGFYQILKHVFPEAEAYEVEEGSHIVTKIGGHYYDIKGERFFDRPCKVKKQDLRYWEECAYGQRLEEMLFKYRSECNKIK